MISQDQLFNEYYFELLKKLKSICRGSKSDSHDARVVLRAIKKNYSSYDKFSSEFRMYANEAPVADVWDSYAALASDIDDMSKWVEDNADAELYKDIPMSCVASEFADALTLHQYMTIINLFRQTMSDDLLSKVVSYMKGKGKEVPSDIDDDKIVTQLQRISYLQKVHADKTMKDHIGSIPNIEDTSLGKLAKEIMQEMNVEELQTSLGNGDIMQALANPDGGLVKLLGTVSQKMISKMSSGEIKQENLLQDAMKLATSIGGKDMGMLGNMASMFGAAGGGGSGGFDMGELSKMMSGMMGNGVKRNNTKVRPNVSNIKKMSKKQDLRLKLEKRKENMSGQVVGEND